MANQPLMMHPGKSLLFLPLCMTLPFLCNAQTTRFWQVNIGSDRRTALLCRLQAEKAPLRSDYLGPQSSLKKTIRARGVFAGTDTVILEFALVPPIYAAQEDLVYAGTLLLKRETSEAYAATFYDYFQKLKSKYGAPGLRQFFEPDDSVSVAALLRQIKAGKPFRFNWHDKQTGLTRSLMYRPDLPEKLALDYRITNLIKLEAYLKDTTDY